MKWSWNALGIHFDRLNDQEGFSKWGAYGQSKLATILHANELGRRLKEDGADITANAGIFEGMVSAFGLGLKTPGQGASTACYVALHPQVKGISGEYFADNNLAKPNAKAADTNLARKLWQFSLDLINKYFSVNNVYSQ